jgi:2-keto-3-deoxy-L-rhamnonate aldolase RhmA
MSRKNSFREAIENGETVYGARNATFSPNLIELYGHIGLDWVWLDFEHQGGSPWNSHTFEDLTRAAEVSDVELVVRIPNNDQSLIRKVLDAGVKNLLIPRLETAEEVRTAVEAGRFEYDGSPGQRGTSASRSTNFGKRNYIETEDDQVCIGVMIEKREAVENIEEIASVPELGFIFIGPGDMSVQLGHAGNREHPDVTRAIDDVKAVADGHSIPAGCIVGDVEKGHEAIDDGYQILRIGGEFSAAEHVLGERLATYRSQNNGSP